MVRDQHCDYVIEQIQQPHVLHTTPSSGAEQTRYIVSGWHEQYSSSNRAMKSLFAVNDTSKWRHGAVLGFSSWLQ